MQGRITNDHEPQERRNRGDGNRHGKFRPLCLVVILERSSQLQDRWRRGGMEDEGAEPDSESDRHGNRSE
jgi:hypothetical protein